MGRKDLSRRIVSSSEREAGVGLGFHFDWPKERSIPLHKLPLVENLNHGSELIGLGHYFPLGFWTKKREVGRGRGMFPLVLQLKSRARNVECHGEDFNFEYSHKYEYELRTFCKLRMKVDVIGLQI